MGTAQRMDREKNVVGTIYIGQDVTELKDIDEWKISMMAMMSHELKSPLHGIIGLSQAMLLDKSTAQKGSVVMISNCATRLLDVVRNLMDTSELLHRRNRPLARDPVHLAGVAEEVVLLCQQAVDKRGVSTMKPSVKIINTLVEPLPVIEADAYRCTQLLYSLVSNAIKFTHKGSVTISASADDVEEKVTVYVKDTGIGISSDNLDRIFEPFDQEDRSEKRGYEGLGMGLALCREIVHQHRGTLAVKSQKGKGSTFQFTLPYKMPVEDKAEGKGYEDDKSVSLRVPATQTRQSTNISDLSGGWSNNSAPSAPVMGRAPTLDPLAARSTSSGAERDGPSKNLAGAQYLPDVGEDSQLVVLSVDDDMINQQVMTSLLQSSQYKLQVASSFGEALNYLLENPPPALILLEVMTPGLSGPDALRTLRKKYSAEVLPIIMISANGDKDTITRPSSRVGNLSTFSA
ncbi:luxQ [Symbiodinium natans]|uniref:histidine kinase n=1 Tax=Symbiodinium natans TaxID=878477 RepID=A0A812KJA1_9DINO|nr:luxQ [Symbiodinium natans]